MCSPPSFYIKFSLKKLKVYEGRGTGAWRPRVRCEGRGPYNPNTLLYVTICNICDFFYIGKTEELTQYMQKHVIYPNNSNFKKNAQNIYELAQK